MCLTVRVGIKRVTIVSDAEEGSAGHCDHYRVFRSDDQYADTPAARIRMENAVRICLAGPIAQRLYKPSSVRRYHASSDYKHALDVAFSALGSTKQVEAWLKWLGIAVRDTFQARWSSVTLLAEELVQRETLTGEEISQLLRREFATKHTPQMTETIERLGSRITPCDSV